MERTDGILRMLKIIYAASQDDLNDFSWAPVLEIFTYLEDEQYSIIGNDSRTVLQYMVTDRENPCSIQSVLLHSLLQNHSGRFLNTIHNRR